MAASGQGPITPPDSEDEEDTRVFNYALHDVDWLSNLQRLQRQPLNYEEAALRREEERFEDTEAAARERAERTEEEARRTVRRRTRAEEVRAERERRDRVRELRLEQEQRLRDRYERRLQRLSGLRRRLRETQRRDAARGWPYIIVNERMFMPEVSGYDS